MFIKCYRCKIVGNHHTAMCEGKKDRKDVDMSEETVTSCLIDRGKSVLLQTAMCTVIGNNEKDVCIKALLDPESQQTYINKRLVKILNLKPLRNVNMVIKAFASESKEIEAKEYEIKIKMLFKAKSIKR